MGIHFYQDPLRAFVERTMARAGLLELPPDARAETATALMVEAQRRVGLEIFSCLDAGSLKRFRILFEHGATEEEISAFLSVRIPDLKERVARVLGSFGDECAASAARSSEV